MALTTAQWHQRFQQQSRWTQDLRNYLYKQIDFSKINQILDVGCGTGALLPELSTHSAGRLYGLDININHLKFAAKISSPTQLVCSDGHEMPFSDSSFDLTLCHFLLLWVQRAAQVLTEMIRVTKPRGYVMALAEPDYGGRIDFPPELSILGDWQQDSLREQGADPKMGRKLRGLFSKSGLKDYETGVLGGQWKGEPAPSELSYEWEVLRSDLYNLLPEEKIKIYKDLENSAWEKGERVLFVPTFYAWGQVEK